MKNELTIKVTIWNEGRHEKLDPNVAAIYPSGIHAAISAGVENEGFAIRCGSLDDPDEGLGEQLLEDTDVLLWWGHIAHEEVSDALVHRIQQRVIPFCLAIPPMYGQRRSRISGSSTQTRSFVLKTQ